MFSEIVPKALQKGHLSHKRAHGRHCRHHKYSTMRSVEIPLRSSTYTRLYEAVQLSYFQFFLQRSTLSILRVLLKILCGDWGV
jgi:hypothetical protein